MSGHSKWATIKRKKGRNDAQRGRLFTRLIKEIAIAARNGGGSVESNSRLRLAVERAKESNMPADNTERAIKRGTGELEGVSYEEVTYEGYGPGGVAIMVDVLTDNRNRTVSELRHVFSRNGGNFGETGAVAWVFQTKGLISVDKSVASEDQVFAAALDAGAEDIDSEGDSHEITTALGDLMTVRQALEDARIKTASAEIARIPQNTVRVEGKQAEQVLRLVEALEEHDDVQKVFANFDIDVEEMAAIAGE